MQRAPHISRQMSEQGRRILGAFSSRASLLHLFQNRTVTGLARNGITILEIMSLAFFINQAEDFSINVAQIFEFSTTNTIYLRLTLHEYCSVYGPLLQVAELLFVSFFSVTVLLGDSRCSLLVQRFEWLPLQPSPSCPQTRHWRIPYCVSPASPLFAICENQFTRPFPRFLEPPSTSGGTRPAGR